MQRFLTALVAVAALVHAPFAARPARAASPLRAIAIAEDERRWSDGELRRYLAHRDPAVRARAALAVGRLQDSASVAALLPLAADPDARVRLEAVFALGQVGRREARATLERATADPDAGVAVRALEALGKLKDPAATPVVAGYLGAASAGMRGEAAVALWRLADTTAAGALLAHLGDADAGVRWRVVYALEKLALPERIVPAVLPALADADPLVRAHAARTLGRQKSARAASALVAALQDSVPAVVVESVRALQAIADSTEETSQLSVLSKLVNSHVDPYVRVTAALAMGDRFAWVATRAAADSQLAGVVLVRGLEDIDPATRAACGRAAVMRFGRDGLNVAVRLEHDKSPYTQADWMESIATLPNLEWATRRFEYGLDRSRPLRVRMTTADLLGRLGPKSPALRPLLDTLRAGVNDADVLYASACAGALGEWGDSASVGLLAKAYAVRGKDADPDARQAIRDALRQLAGRAVADSVERANAPKRERSRFAKDFQDAPRERHAVIRFAGGEIELELLGDEAPQTVRNFVKLARAGYFDGQTVHRVVPDFVVQAGDPTGTGSGGPGWTIRCEYNRERYDAGMVGMALSGKDTGGSQWFITLSPQPHLDGRYTIFARVVRGLDLARGVQLGAGIKKVEILP